MSTTFESLAALMVVLPGFLSSLVYGSLQERKEVSGFRQFMEALAFSFVIQLLLACVGRDQAIVPRWENERVAGLTYQAPTLGWALLLSLLLPVGLSALAEHDLLLRVARRIRVTARTSRASTWLDVFADHRQFVVVHFKSGARVMGWPYQYSDSPQEGMIYLQHPVWVTENDEYKEMNADGFFSCNPSEVTFITFVGEKAP